MLLAACVKDKIDDPPANGEDPGLVANTTIAHVKSLFTGTIIPIDSDFVIKGVVIGDDHSGNLYKSLVIQDSTGGINIQLDQSNFFTTYKVGRNVFIKCRGLVLGDYNGLIQLGGYIDHSSGTPSVGRIPQSLIPAHLVAGKWNQPYTVKTITDISSLDYNIDQNKIIRIDNVHFENSAVCQTWADLIGQTSGNRNLVDANGNIIVVRTSNFTTFAGNKIPGDTGSVIGIFQIYGSTAQLIIRELSDVLMDPPTCITFGPAHSMAELRTQYSMGATAASLGSTITGIVISDRTKGNITTNNLVIQDSTGGIVVRFTGPNTFSVGDMVTINVSDQELSEFNGLLEVNNVPTSFAAWVSSGNSVTPRVATIADIISNGEAWESTLVTINNATITGSGTYNGTTTLADGTGNLAMFTRSVATFASVSYPATPVSVTGYISDFNGRQINIRDTTDIQ